jgi:hypothetical protein
LNAVVAGQRPEDLGVLGQVALGKVVITQRGSGNATRSRMPSPAVSIRQTHSISVKPGEECQ